MQLKCKQFPGAVTSLTPRSKRVVLVGCNNGDIYELDTLTFDAVLLSTCHTGQILDIAFPK